MTGVASLKYDGIDPFLSWNRNAVGNVGAQLLLQYRWSIVSQVVILALAGASPSLGNEPVPPDHASVEFFEKHIRPILVARCIECHGADKQKGGLRLDTPAAIMTGGDQGPPVVPQKPEESLLIDAIGYQVEGFQMPPKGKISDEEIRLLTEWVRRGAAIPKGLAANPVVDASGGFSIESRRGHWSYAPVRRPPLPAIASSDTIMSPVDSFLEQKRLANQLTAAPAADRVSLLRRVTYDLTGLPPTVMEIQTFVSDSRPDAYQRQVDVLLASPRYGERWARHWLDLVRFAETLGHEFDFELPEAWRYRDYVIRAFNADIPYDAFVREHVAGDLLESPRRDPVSGMTESGIGPAFYWFGEASHSPVDVRQAQADRIDNQIDVLSKTFLAQSVACARCHDHKFDAISQKDYYAIAGFLKSSRYDQRSIDAPEVRSKRLADFAEKKREGSAIAQRLIADRWIKDIEDLPHRLNEMPTPAHPAAPTDPLYVWQQLSNANGDLKGRSFTEVAAELQRKLSDQKQRAETSREIPFASFESSERSRWNIAGDALALSPDQIGLLSPALVDGKWKVSLTPRRFGDSRLVSRKLEGTLRSETFTIDKTFVHIKAAGRGGRINVVIDGFALIRDPIYGSLMIKLNDDRSVWRTINLSKWQGHHAYIEFVDQSIANLTFPPGEATPPDGYFAVDEIVFSSHAEAPGDPPQAINLTVLAEPVPTSLDELAERYRAVSAEAFSIVNDSAKAKPSMDHRLAASLLESLLSAGLLDQELPAESSKEQITRLQELAEEIEARDREWDRPSYVPSLADGTGEDEFLFIRGNHKTLAAPSSRRFLEVIDGPAPLPISKGSGRVELSERFTDPGNPLLSRVWANRIWRHHFGEGIVRSPDDFGRMGQDPTHPELLDWLASELVDSGWSTKHLHRQLLESRAYQMSSVVSDESRERDPRNESMTRMPLRRLEAESLRDALLVISGRFDSAMGGPGVDPHLTEFMNAIGRPGTSGPIDGAGRRSVYLKVRRNFLSPLLLAFDYPLPQTTIGRRNTSNVPAQALTMLNDPFILEECRQWAISLVKEEPDVDRRMARAYLDAFGRPVRPEEMDRVRQFLETEGLSPDPERQVAVWTEVCHSLVNAKEFLFVP